MVPVSRREGQATFLQPGVVVWRGSDPALKGDDNRYDFSLGLVRRRVLGFKIPKNGSSEIIDSAGAIYATEEGAEDNASSDTPAEV